jgi:hypothetical protein
MSARRLRVSALLGLALCAIPVASARATITVANQNDSGTGSLRQAIGSALAGESIVVPPGEYMLTSGELAIAKTLTITGAGADDTIVRASGAFRVFHTSGTSSDITISRLAIRGGRPPGVSGVVEGGGVLSEAASLTLNDDIIAENRADADGLGSSESGGIAEGGGVAVSKGVLTLLDSSLAGNSASTVGGSGRGGGIAEGGGLYSAGGLVLEGDEFVGNVADARGGQGPSSTGQSGGIAEGGGAAVLAVGPVDASTSTFAANTVDASAGPGGNGGIGEGGGIFALSNEPLVSLSDLTVAENIVRALPNGIADGGGADIGANSPGVMTLTNATISANTAEGEPSASGGGDAYLGGANTKVENTLVSGGVSSAGKENCTGVPTSLGHNLDSLDQCNFHAAGDLIRTDPLLGSLQDNGGPTRTLALSAGSPAIDAGGNEGCPTTDQRGVRRPQGSACDIGAFEVAPASASTAPATGVGLTSATLQGTAFNPDVVGGTYFFQWGTSTAYGSQTPAQPLEPGIFGQQAAAMLSATLSNLAPGTVYHFRIVAVNPEGTAFGVDQTFTTLHAPTTGSSPPTITLAGLTNKRFKVSRQDTAVSARKTPLGTSFRFTLSTSAKVEIAIARMVPGLRRGHACVAPTAKLRRGHARHCQRSLAIGTLTRSSEPGGADSIPFSGRMGHRPLHPGAYSVKLSASNAGGRSAPVTLSFTVVR